MQFNRRLHMRKLFVRSHILGSCLKGWLDPLIWIVRGYPVPVPAAIKRSVLRRYGDESDTWVETGTYLGKTTKWLASRTKNVITIEPDLELATRAQALFRKNRNVRVICGLSETVLEKVLPQLSGRISFWLDGHFSGGLTARGSHDTPIREELRLIESHLNQFSAVKIFVDDFREFATSEEVSTDYPSRLFLVEWATRNHFDWLVEYDIFIALKRDHNVGNR